VTVADPDPLVAVPVNSDAGMVSVPVIVPFDSVIVNGTLMLAEVEPRLATGTDTLKVPLPMPLSVAVPLAVKFVARDTAAFTVSVVCVVVCAFAMAPIKTARAQVFVIFFIFCNLLR
jgi:hypothetical protein